MINALPAGVRYGCENVAAPARPPVRRAAATAAKGGGSREGVEFMDRFLCISFGFEGAIRSVDSGSHRCACSCQARVPWEAKFNLRVGEQLRRRLAMQAPEEHLSLNQYVIHRLNNAS